MENNFNNINKEIKKMKGQLLIKESQKRNISKEYKLNKDILNKLQGDHEKLVKERDDFQRKNNELNNEIEIMKMNNNNIINININNNIKTQRSLKLKDTIDSLTKEKSNLKEKNNVLEEKINEIDKKLYRSKTINKLTKVENNNLKVQLKEKEKDIESLEIKLNDAGNKINDLQKSNDILNSKNKKLNMFINEKDSLAISRAIDVNENINFEEKISNYKKEINDKNKIIQKYRKTIYTLQQQLKKNNNNIEVILIL